MTTKNQIALLSKQIEKITDLSANPDYATLEAWLKQTELLLKDTLGKDASEVSDFHRLDGRSSVILSDDQANKQNDRNAYIRDLKSGQSILTGVIEYLKSTLSDEPEAQPVSAGTLDALHNLIKEKCSGLYLSENYAEAVEKGFKVVRDRLRDLTGYETGQEAFGKGHLYITGATAANVDFDFQQAVKFLTMAIDQFRNEKSHTSDGRIEDPIRAYEYLALSSLAMHLLTDTKIKEPSEKQKPTKQKPNVPEQQPKSDEKLVSLDELQILALRIFASMKDYKELLASSPSGGGAMFHPLGDLSNPEIMKELADVDGGEFEASLEEMASWGLLTIRWNKSGDPIYKLAKQGYTVIREYTELSK